MACMVRMGAEWAESGRFGGTLPKDGLQVHGSGRMGLRMVLSQKSPVCARSSQSLAASSRGVRLLQLAW